MSEDLISFSEFFDEEADRAWRFTAALEKFQLKFATALKRARQRILARTAAEKGLRLAAVERKRLAGLPKGPPPSSGWKGLVAGLGKAGNHFVNNVSAMMRK
jgi:hypothetical protein